MLQAGWIARQRWNVITPLLLSFLVGGPSSADEPSGTFSYSVILSTQNDPATAKSITAFRCTDPLYVLVVWEHLLGSHEAQVVWYTPAGKRQDWATHRFVSTSDRYLSWFRLDLFAPGGASRLLSLDDGRRIGKWRADLYLDGEKLDSRHFVMLACWDE